MMRLLVMSVLAFVLTSCGTVRNFSDEESGGMKTPYGGVKLTCQTLTAGDVEGALAQQLLPLVLCDVALSAVGDTVTLPVTLPLAVMRAVHERRSDSPASQDSKPPQIPNWLQDSQPPHSGMTKE